MLRRLCLIAMFLLLSCSLVYADFGDESTLGNQDSSGNYRWRVTSDGDLIPGTTAVNDIGTSSAAVAEIHATTLYVTDGYSAQGKTASVEYAAGSRTISLNYGIVSLTSGTYSVITVPDGSYAGQTINIMVETDGGWAIVTPTTCTGFTSLNLDEALDQVTLRWISATYGWILVGQFGATLE